MAQEIELLVNAIGELKPTLSYFKDYVFPIASALFTSLLGAGIAFLTFKHQDRIAIEKSKLDSANKWTLLAEEARSTLIAIKSNYHGQLTRSPAQRISAVPSVLFHANPIVEEYQSLSFIIKENKDGDFPKWSQIPRIRAMISNYNYLLQLWSQRNEYERPLRLKIMHELGAGKAAVDVNQNEIIRCIGEGDFCCLVDLTERVIKLTDDLIIELNDFLLNFPSHANRAGSYFLARVEL